MYDTRAIADDLSLVISDMRMTMLKKKRKLCCIVNPGMVSLVFSISDWVYDKDIRRLFSGEARTGNIS